MNANYQKIETTEQLEKALHEKQVYESVMMSLGSAAEVEAFYARILSRFKAGNLRARYHPNETEDRVKLMSKYPRQSDVDLFKSEKSRGKGVMLWAHPDPANSDLMIVDGNPWHQDPSNIDLLCQGTPFNLEPDRFERPISLLKYLAREKKKR